MANVNVPSAKPFIMIREREREGENIDSNGPLDELDHTVIWTVWIATPEAMLR